MNRRLLLSLFGKVGALSLATVNMPAHAIISSTMGSETKQVVFSPETDQLGQFYLAAYPEDITACRHLSLKLGCNPSSPLIIDFELAQAISKQIRNDFIRGNTVNLGGWLLSLTELRLTTLNVL